ncbi:hypothetical protein [Dactylosporangium salmoneum]|uniref:FG-GAP repeat protein n=1 Tax=Dactylosporangium salmoneum TaxID=53361 RepID=A0ABP5TNJ6_9ACTN
MPPIGGRSTGVRWAVAALAALAAIAPASTARAASSAAGPTNITTSTYVPVTDSPITLTFTAEPGFTAPVRFVYEINGRSRSVKATGGTASIAYTPVGRTIRVSAHGVSRDGSAGPEGRLVLGALAATPYADKDLDGDGRPDLLTAGGTAGLPTGVWLAKGRTGGNGRVRVPAADIGVNGNGVGTSFDGSRVITGQFTGTGFTDVLVYYAGGVNPGSGIVIDGSGDGTALQAQLGFEHTISAGFLTDLNGENPRQLVNAYHSAGTNYAYADLLGVFTGALEYYANQNGTLNLAFPVALTNPTPTGGTNWADWTLASLSLPSGTAMFLWNAGTGGLYLWTGVTFTDNGDFTGSLAYTQRTISTDWNRGVELADLQAADFGGDGVPDLWAVGPAGDVTAYVGGSRATTPQHLL